MTDLEIIASIQDGSRAQEEAIRILYKKHFNFVYKQMKDNRALSEEMARDAYTDAVVTLRSHIAKGRFEGRSKLSTYLYKIFSNKCIDAIRKKSTYKSKVEKEMQYELPLHLANKDAKIVEKLTVKETFGKLRALIGKLGETCQQVLLDWGFWGFSMEEIAQKRGFKDANTVRSKKFNCLKQLRKHIARSGIEAELGF